MTLEHENQHLKDEIANLNARLEKSGAKLRELELFRVQNGHLNSRVEDLEAEVRDHDKARSLLKTQQRQLGDELEAAKSEKRRLLRLVEEAEEEKTHAAKVLNHESKVYKFEQVMKTSLSTQFADSADGRPAHI